MSIKKISIKINNSEKTIEQHSIIAGQQGIGQQNQPLHINAKKNVNYLLIDEETNFAPENIAVKRVDKNLFIAFEGSDIEQPDIIIENYFADNGEIGYHEGSSNLIIGQHENGQYFPYIPESAEKSDAISQLADGQATGQAIGGDALAPVWAFNPWWLAALIPIAGVIASSSGGGSSSSKPVEHAPEAKDDRGVTKEGAPVTMDVLKNDTDLDGDIDPSTAVIVTNGTKGTATFDADGKLVYTPKKGEVGTDTITYQVTDKNGNVSNTATVTVTIDAAPVANDDSVATKEGAPVTMDVLHNDTDLDGDIDPSTAVIMTNGTKGTATFDADGKLVYTPKKGEVGTDTITYQVTDKNGNVSNTATVTVTIDAAPVANDDSVATKEGAPVTMDVLKNDTDLDGDIDPSTVTIVTNGTKGTATFDADGKLVYTPNRGEVGTDTITYQVTDKNGNVSNTATVTVTIDAAPVANDDSVATKEGAPVTIDVLHNDTDLDGDIDPSTAVIMTNGTKGTATFDADGKLVYTPKKGEVGTDTITYQVTDKNGNVSNTATVTVTIDAAPVANDDSRATKDGVPVTIDVLHNDTDLDGDIDPSTAVIVTNGTKGTATFDADGKLVYTPNRGEVGTDTITYQVTDKNGNVSNTATVTVTIDAAPVANDDSVATKEGASVTIDVLHNDTDLDGDIDPSTAVIMTNGTKGTATFDADGKLVYTPKKGEVGTDTITYQVTDKNGNVSNTATVTVTIDAAPVANDDDGVTKEGAPVTMDVLHNDTDLDGDIDPSTAVIMTNGTKGTATFDADGKLVYTPKKGEVGTDTITYQVTDKNGNVSNTATVTVTIDAAPVANDDSVATKEGAPVTMDVLKNDTDLDGDIDPSTAVIVTNGTKGTATFDADGKLVYTPKKGEVGTDTITYQVTDKNGNVSNTATVTVTIDAAPVANDDRVATKDSVPVTMDVLHNDTDLDGDIDPSTAVIVTNGTKGTATFDADGKLVYTPKKGEVGTDTITYQVTDKNGNVSNTATVTVTIDAAPVANDDRVATKDSVPVTIDVLHNDTDLDGDIDPSTAVIVTNGNKGTATFDADGKLVYTPNRGEVGTDTITYQVTDKNGNVSNTATVTVTIDAAPIANDDSRVTKDGVPVTIDVLHNDTDLDGDIDPSTAVIVTNGTKGTATFDADGKLVYTPNRGEVGTDTITYTVKDKNGNVSNIAEVTIEITPSLPSVVDVYEKGLRTDGTADSALAVTTGTIILANPNDKPTTEQDLKITEPTTTLTSGGKPVIWEVTSDGFVGKTSEGKDVISVTVTDVKNENGQTSVDYHIDLKGLVDHPAGTDSLKIDFGLSNGIDIVDTEIIIHDDKPFSDNVEVVVQAPTNNTFYANVIISLDLSSSMGKRDSGISDESSRTAIKTRYDAALDSIESLLNSYEERLNSADSGDVRVSLNGFADEASVINPSLQTTHGTSHWFTLDEAKDLINSLKGNQGKISHSLNIGVNTNYDAALQQIVDSYNNLPASGTGPVTEQSVDNTFFFISDGTPNMGNNVYDPGISEQSPQDYVPGSAYTDIGEDKWTEFLVDNGIRSVAIGIGQDMVTVNNGKTGSDYLKPVAFDGKHGTDNDQSDVIVLKDMSSLGNILSKYVPNENVIESSFSKGKDATSSLTFGADGMKSISVEVDGITYKYDPLNKSVSFDGNDKSNWADFGNGEIAIKTNAGGLFSISLGEKNFGDFSYRPSTTRPVGVDKEEFTLTLTDNDGTSYQPSITVNISDLKESTSVSPITSDLSLLKLFSQENTMELHEMDVDGSIASTNLSGFMNSSLDALQENQAAII
ncbi:Ig-like domain-containing protein [Providencia huaxiensis]|uniref:Ig-like domain-containing protein n=2 Tax=Providencia TaxID=586 RepID=UPI0034E50A8A